LTSIARSRAVAQQAGSRKAGSANLIVATEWHRRRTNFEDEPGRSKTAHARRGAADCGEYRQAAGAMPLACQRVRCFCLIPAPFLLSAERQAAGVYNAWLRAIFCRSPAPCLFWDLACFGIDEMNPPATDARHGFISLALGQMIGTPAALYLLADSWAAVDERDHSKAHQTYSAARAITTSVAVFAGDLSSHPGSPPFGPLTAQLQ
jgi:hypothetical protein